MRRKTGKKKCKDTYIIKNVSCITRKKKRCGIEKKPRKGFTSREMQMQAVKMKATEEK